jgi:hypothetical protein
MRRRGLIGPLGANHPDRGELRQIHPIVLLRIALRDEQLAADLHRDRPSTEGLDWTGIGSGGGGAGEGTIGLGSIGTIGHGARTRIDPLEFLKKRLRAAANTCGVAPRLALSLQFQATLDEIVAVDSVELVGSTDTVAKSCVEDEIWAVELPSVFDDGFKVWIVDA